MSIVIWPTSHLSAVIAENCSKETIRRLGSALECAWFSTVGEPSEGQSIGIDDPKQLGKDGEIGSMGSLEDVRVSRGKDEMGDPGYYL